MADETPAQKGRRRSVRVSTPQLSCELCRARKVKCDKLEPCSNCVSSGSRCVPVRRSRLPRGRHVRRPGPATSKSPEQTGDETASSEDKSLADRVHRLESLVEHMSAATFSVGQQGSQQHIPQGVDTPSSLASGPPIPSSISPSCAEISSVAQTPAHRGDGSWTGVAMEISALRREVNGFAGATVSHSQQAYTPSRLDGGMLLLGLSSSEDAPASACNPEISRTLCQIFLKQVDPIVKILHKPSLTRWMVHGQSYLNYPAGHPAVQALSAAVCYAAANSLTEGQCETSFKTARYPLVAQCKRQCEAALAAAGLLDTRDLTVVQAFVIYLATRRAAERSRPVWTLVALAVRLARPLCFPPWALDSEKQTNFNFFDDQRRKRLWHYLSVLDLQVCFGQRSAPLTSTVEDGRSMALPANIDDDDFDTDTTAVLPGKEGLTDTSYSLMTYYAVPAGRLTVSTIQAEQNQSPDLSPSATTSLPQSRRRDLVDTCERQMMHLAQYCDPESSSYAWFTYHSLHLVLAASKLATLRPIRPPTPQLPDATASGAAATKPPPPPWDCITVDGVELLRLTLTVLDKARLMHTDPRGEGFRWCVNIPWHALAIAFAECYACTDAALVRRAWPLVEAAYEQHKSFMLRSGTAATALHAPLESLLRRTRRRVASLLQDGEMGGGVGGSGSGSLLPSTAGAVSSTQPMMGLSSGTPSAGGGVAASSLGTTSSEVGGTPAVSLAAPLTLQSQFWDAGQQSLVGDTPFSTGDQVATGQMQVDTAEDLSWKTWEEFISGISFDEVGIPESFLYDV
ncbi:uncharacterized protein E0L32_007409 [Thyridium curvatum]|uniref:Zn(2)-C6 fungal-type domain-containing protein n=1 Tax=Thyridium curvatum TaxID=1093900 RepID=A0A507B4B6_9PEZI|nr:uncharacterized protein E0L32_007409 [Thyridium curvatum]TPX11911.1 hypothetical protein E0L32_007409 [Thyridium curvatum]